MRRWINILISFSVLFSFQSCAKKMTEGTGKLPSIQVENVVHVLDSISESVPDFLYAKISSKYADNKQSGNFKTSLKINKDSSVHLLMTYAGIPMLAALVTTDSVKISNKREKCNILEEISFLKNIVGAELTLKDLQGIFIGRPISFDKSKKYYLISENQYYVLSTNEASNENSISYFLTKDLSRIEKIELINLNEGINLSVTYLDYALVEGYLIPKNISADIKTKNNSISFSMTFDKVEVNVSKNMVIVIPESYEKCN